ncbi:zinc-finger domain-containing protein [Thiohalobacter sp. IOR34]|uniref:zinc-finger domain-containing protein n=1 Tax=Thiohalobacter sp. IOR34 TaxID=3057176 RepID=UPI0025B205B1|nr:zinc-finger domain-containing protein [Thiohalobacter sp. IOR34]WJW75275.1 zinc-finger domain-containing protein [Thiohalobacter sp. IOR34]
MTNPDTAAAAGTDRYRRPNAERRYEIERADRPVCCPQPDMSLWDSHPRVYLPLAATGHARCPYCSAEYVLKGE